MVTASFWSWLNLSFPEQRVTGKNEILAFSHLIPRVEILSPS